MTAQLRDIAVFLDASPEGDAVGLYAARLAARHGAHLIGVYGLSHADETSPRGAYVRGAAAIGHMIEQQRAEAEQKVLSAGRGFAALAREHEISSEFRVIWQDAPDDHAVLRGLHCDLIVTATPRLADLPSRWSTDHLLLATGAPVLTVPQSATNQAPGDVVVIAWNHSREARRAVNDALPLLSKAGRVIIFTAEADHRRDAIPEGALALQQHLARHDITAEVAREPTEGRTAADVIIAYAKQSSAGVVIIGAYSRPRSAEILFGGTTRSLLADAPMPLYLSR